MLFTLILQWLDENNYKYIINVDLTYYKRLTIKPHSITRIHIYLDDTLIYSFNQYVNMPTNSILLFNEVDNKYLMLDVCNKHFFDENDIFLKQARSIA